MNRREYMGKEFVVENLEDMCSFMCDNELLYKTCKRCGRKLKSEKARALGYGPICWKKRSKNNRSHLF